jgi:hypothetical protein
MGKRPTYAELDAAAATTLASWRDEAACLGRGKLMDPLPLFRDKTTTRRALEVCSACPVLAECARWVLALPDAADPGGVCGGMPEDERTRRRRGHRRAPSLAAAEGVKWCRRCHMEKPHSEFFADKSNADGRNSYCKSCNNEAKRDAPSRQRIA